MKDFNKAEALNNTATEEVAVKIQFGSSFHVPEKKVPESVFKKN